LGNADSAFIANGFKAQIKLKKGVFNDSGAGSDTFYQLFEFILGY